MRQRKIIPGVDSKLLIKDAAKLMPDASRRGFLRGQLLRDSGNDDFLLQPLGTSGSHLLASLAEANCLAVVDEDVTDVGVGEEIQVCFLAQRG